MRDVWVIARAVPDVVASRGGILRTSLQNEPKFVEIQADDHVLVWASLGRSGEGNGWLAGYGIASAERRRGAQLVVVAGKGLHCRWDRDSLEAVHLGHLVPLDGSLKRVDADSLDRLLREDTHWNEEEAEVASKDPSNASKTARPRRRGAKAGPVERAVIRESSRGSSWRPGRGRWK